MTDMAAIPVPLFAVPYAAPKALKTMAAEAPITAKKEAYSGLALEDMAARAGPGRGEAPLGPGEREGGGGGGGGRLRRGAGPPQAALGHKMAETGREGGGGRRGGGRLRAAQGRGPAAGGRERARGVAAQSSEIGRAHV